MISLGNYEKMEAERPPVAANNRGPTDTELGGIGVAKRTCGRGHDLAVEGFYSAGRYVDCRACKRDRRKRAERAARVTPCACGCGELVSGRLKRGHWGRLAPSRTPARNGDKTQARGRVHVLIRAGKLPLPSTLPCSDCGKAWQPGVARFEYDHFLGYAAEHHEDVQAVCASCHRKRDAARRRAAS